MLESSDDWARATVVISEEAGSQFESHCIRKAPQDVLGGSSMNVLVLLSEGIGDEDKFLQRVIFCLATIEFVSSEAITSRDVAAHKVSNLFGNRQ